MNKFIKTSIIVLGLTSNINASNTFTNNISLDEEFAKMQNLMNSMVNQSFFNNSLSKLQNINYPKVDMQEKDDRYILKFALAGIDKSEIKLSLKNTTLILEGEKKTAKEDKSKSYLKQEIFVGKFKRIIQLPDNIIIDKLTNKYKNGILTVTIPKKHKTQSSYKVLKIN